MPNDRLNKPKPNPPAKPTPIANLTDDLALARHASQIKDFGATAKADDKATGELEAILDASMTERARLNELVESLTAENEAMEKEAKKIRRSIDKDIAKNTKVHQQAQSNLATAMKALKREENELEEAKKNLQEEKERGVLLGKLEKKRQEVREAEREKEKLQKNIARLLDTGEE
jgi:hypothetical protein